MRIGETIRLDRDDVDHRHQLLRVIESKFGKSRELALHETTMHALDHYAELRDRLCPRPSCEAFFISRNGTRLLSQVVHRVFARLVETVGLEPRPGCRRPRPQEYADVVVMPMLVRRGCSERSSVVMGRHNQSARRKARSVSGGR